ncbi:MAG TPA: hypothetical protein PLF54_14210, partial [Deltaproteobacteria bacterium]|nr:hypothetical protein [Deltaproteobacteria bacterium]
RLEPLNWLGMAVTLLGVINDRDCSVEVIIDRDLLKYDAMQCHPLVNTSTLVVSTEDVMKFLELTGHLPLILDVPGQENVPPVDKM